MMPLSLTGVPGSLAKGVAVQGRNLILTLDGWTVSPSGMAA
jgi:hypothetical protein